MKKLLLIAALALSTQTFAQVPTTDPVEVFKTVEDIVRVGKATEQEVEAAASAKHCTIKADHNADKLLLGDDGKSYLGTNKAVVSFLGENHISDSFYLIWEFTDRKDFEVVRDSLHNYLESLYGVGGNWDPGSLFDDAKRFRTETSHLFIYLSWANYGDYVKVEVINEDAASKEGDVEKNITELMAAFPEAKGKIAEIEPFAENWGCIVKDMEHPKWLTMSGRTTKNCRGMNIYFERSSEDPEQFIRLRFNPAVPGEKVVEEYIKVLGSLYGTPEEFDVPMHDEPTQLYKDGDLGFALSRVELQGQPSVDITVSPYDYAKDTINTTIKVLNEKARVEKERDEAREKRRQERMKERFKSSAESTPKDTSAPFTQKRDTSEPFTQRQDNSEPFTQKRDVDPLAPKQ